MTVDDYGLRIELQLRPAPHIADQPVDPGIQAVGGLRQAK